MFDTIKQYRCLQSNVFVVLYRMVLYHSMKTMLVNPRKVYCIDTGLVESLSLKGSKDLGHKFENLIFNHLRRTNKEIFYFDNKSGGECDFVVMSRGKAKKLVQVCYELTPDNLDREINGAMEAMKFFKLKKAALVTFSDKDVFEKDGCTVAVLPAHEFLSENNYF